MKITKILIIISLTKESFTQTKVKEDLGLGECVIYNLNKLEELELVDLK